MVNRFSRLLGRRKEEEYHATPYVSQPGPLAAPPSVISLASTVSPPRPSPAPASPPVIEAIPSILPDFSTRHEYEYGFDTKYDPQAAPPTYMSRQSSVNVTATRDRASGPSPMPPHPLRTPAPAAPVAAPSGRGMSTPSIISEAPSRPPQPLAPGDLPLARPAGQRITALELRSLREDIRRRYQLDTQIWGERYLRERDRDVTEQKIREADALMNKIRATVIMWDRDEHFDPHTNDYANFRQIVDRICSEGKRDWVKEPPWMAAQTTGMPTRERRMY